MNLGVTFYGASQCICNVRRHNAKFEVFSWAAPHPKTQHLILVILLKETAFMKSSDVYLSETVQLSVEKLCLKFIFDIKSLCTFFNVWQKCMA